MMAATIRLPKPATVCGVDETRATADGGSTTVSDLMAGGGSIEAASAAGASSANSSVSPASIVRGAREAIRERERSGARRTDSGGRGSDGVLISGSYSSPAGEKSGNDSIGDAALDADDAGVEGAELSSHRSPIGTSSRTGCVSARSAGSLTGAASSEKS